MGYDLIKAEASMLLAKSSEVSTLSAKSIATHARENNKDKAIAIIAQSILKTSRLLDARVDDSLAHDLASEWVETHIHESIEDFLIVLKNGRRGAYQVNRYNKLNLDVLNKWMSFQLDKKAIEREKLHTQQNLIQKENDNFDAERFYQRGREYLEAQKKKEKQEQVKMENTQGLKQSGSITVWQVHKAKKNYEWLRNKDNRTRFKVRESWFEAWLEYLQLRHAFSTQKTK